MNRIDFPSLANPQRRYTWNRSAFDSPWRFDWRGSAPLHACAGQFETYGDGTVQHSPEVPVPTSSALDYLASLGSYLETHHDTETLEMLANDWPKPHYNVSTSTVKFAAELRHKEEKTQYYCLNELKKSTADSKRHDKRWDEVPPWANGSINAVFGIHFKDRSLEPLDRLASVEKIDELMRGLDPTSSPSNNYARAEIAGLVPRRDSGDWDSDLNHAANNINTAFRAVNLYVESARHMDNARRCFSSLRHNYIRNELGITEEPAAA